MITTNAGISRRRRPRDLPRLVRGPRPHARSGHGGPVPDCGPVAIPWLYARHVVDYPALNFFDGVLNGNAEALARLDPAVLFAIEDLEYQSK